MNISIRKVWPIRFLVFGITAVLFVFANGSALDSRLDLGTILALWIIFWAIYFFVFLILSCLMRAVTKYRERLYSHALGLTLLTLPLIGALFTLIVFSGLVSGLS